MQQLHSALALCVSADLPTLTDQILDCQAELDRLIQVKTEGAIIRSRAKWVEAGEKNTKYFLNLEKSYNSCKSINRIKDENGLIVCDQQLVLQALKNYFASFYTEISTVMETQTKYISISVSDKECLSALNSMSNNKCPGSDGYIVKF